MKTINQNLNRFTAGDNINTAVNASSLSMLWHIVLHNRISVKDSLFLDSLAPQYCSLFLMNETNIIYASNRLQEMSELITTHINFSTEASYAQQVYDKNHGYFRIFTTPLDQKTLIGLTAPAGLASISDIEDAFLHKVYHLQKEYSLVVNSRDNLHEIIKKTDPVLIINRTDDQIIGYNKSALTFFNISQHDIINTDLQMLQKKCFKVSNRKIQITNSAIGKTDCSVIQYTLNKSDSLNSKVITEKLKSHAEYLLKSYQELQTNKDINNKFIETKIAAVNRCYQDITKLHTNEKEELHKHTGHTDAVKH